MVITWLWARIKTKKKHNRKRPLMTCCISWLKKVRKSNCWTKAQVSKNLKRETRSKRKLSRMMTSIVMATTLMFRTSMKTSSKRLKRANLLLAQRSKRRWRKSKSKEAKSLKRVVSQPRNYSSNSKSSRKSSIKLRISSRRRPSKEKIFRKSLKKWSRNLSLVVTPWRKKRKLRHTSKDSFN